MKLENQVPQLHLCQELHEELKKKEMEMETLFWWLNPFKEQGWQVVQKHVWDFHGHHEYYPAPTCSELGELMKERSTSLPYYDMTIDHEGWTNDKCLNYEKFDTFADAMCKQAIYLLKNNLLTNN